MNWYKLIVRPILFWIDPERLHSLFLVVAKWLESPKPQRRQCSECGAEIAECMGFVNAGDFLANAKPVREVCGKCVLKLEPQADLKD
jgi:ribosomal protein S27AE